MYIPSDIRFQTTGVDALAAASFLLPVRLMIDRPTAEAALTEARRLTELLRSSAAGLELPSGRLELVEPASRSEVVMEVRPKGELRLQLTLCVSVTPTPHGDFWSRVATVLRVTDFVERFSGQSLGKGIEVDAGRIELVAPEPAKTN